MKELPPSKKKENYTPLLKFADTVQCQLSYWKNKKHFQKLRNSNEEYSLKGFDELKCIFVHIPKSAGVSINKELFGNLGGAHRTVRTYKRIYGPYTYSKYFKFTFVRNPYSRLLSAYRFLKKGGFCEKDRLWAKKNLNHFSTFSDFLSNWLTHKSIMKYDHFKPQYMFICDRSFEPEIDFIGRFESIEEDFDKICNKLKINRILKKHNQGPKKEAHWTSFYTDEQLQKVYKIYQKDFELFGYNATL